ncbi:MAG: hypothetical protein HUJ54_02770 [Erysipelotrichaceae bacterium]|nr:hypothetical protein [Erysipelotrichaceae bacterium]
MKLSKTTIGLAAAAMLLAGCAAQQTNNTSAASGETSAQIANPTKQVTKEELARQTGIELDAAQGAQDVVFTVIDDADGGKLAQVSFTLDGTEYNYRAESVSDPEGKDISGVYGQWTSEEPVEIQHCKGTYKTGSEGSVVVWTDVAPGISYSLSTNGKTDKDSLVKMASSLFVPAQGEV